MSATEHWTEAPAKHDYAAAENYLSLLVSPDVAHRLADELQKAAIDHRKAKDLLRASGLPVLAPDNIHVAKDLDKVRTGKPLSPALLVRGKLASGVQLTIADGYHRICASYHLNEDADIPCRIVDFSPA